MSHPRSRDIETRHGEIIHVVPEIVAPVKSAPRLSLYISNTVATGISIDRHYCGRRKSNSKQLKTKPTAMSTENLPSGREQAIETLIDMEPHGSFYRAARVLVSTICRQSVIVQEHP